MNTGCKSIALVLNAYFSELASRSVCSAQWGFVPGRTIDEDIV